MTKQYLYLFLILTIFIILGFVSLQNQEKFLFIPHPLSDNHQYRFENEFKELNIETNDNKSILNCLLFSSKLDTIKGVILFFHGNSGNNQGWGHTSDIYTEAGYDIMYFDYRGFGKSTGRIENENQLIQDGIQLAEFLLNKYQINDLILTGTSIGTGIAAQVALKTRTSALLLNAPFFSLEDLIIEKTRIFPREFIEYKFLTREVLPQIDHEILIFHGKNDKLISPEHSRKLSRLNSNIKLHIIPESGHNDLFHNEEFKILMMEYLN